MVHQPHESIQIPSYILLLPSSTSLGYSTKTYLTTIQALNRQQGISPNRLLSPGFEDSLSRRFFTSPLVAFFSGSFLILVLAPKWTSSEVSPHLKFHRGWLFLLPRRV
ncbi:hypothetical protein BDV24DRAFT_130090 [Aspergillus arachidicola]|uniref:Uncharacterized protein n=1 Tax=Aspergillus arachidicola TaxID=656916 RepID=A0A5N6YAS3_9EURO|nr:hypothetical protein BDV24DRAFT_130090 [Aspergillus arachidicola]